MVRKYCLHAIVILPVAGFLFVGYVTVAGRNSLTPPGWVAVLTTILPYLYAGLFLCSLLLFGLLRRKLLLVPLAGIPISVLVLWGGAVLPQKAQPPEHIEPMKVMVWNVQRMGEFSGPRAAIAKNIECVSELIQQEAPDVFALLEVTYNQLTALQEQLGIPASHCLWSDYYGTGEKRFGGLATCIVSHNDHLEIKLKRKLDLPPNWQYLFMEVLHTQNTDIPPINFLALHIAPPKVTHDDITDVIKDIFKLKRDAFGRAMTLLKNYEHQVKLQGSQADQALRYIEERFKDPTIIAGDFNSTRDAALHTRFRDSLTDTWSTAGFGFGATRYWGNFLPLRIDYIYASPEFAVQDAQTLSSDCSDHMPVISTVFLPPSPAPTPTE